MPSSEFSAVLLASAGWRRLPEQQALNGSGMSPEHLLHRELIKDEFERPTGLTWGSLCTAETSQPFHNAPHLNITGQLKQEQCLKKTANLPLYWQCLH